MDSGRIRAVVVLLLAVTALGAAGAAIDGGAAGGGSPGAGDGSGAGLGEGEDTGFIPAADEAAGTSDSPWFRIVFGAIVALVAIGVTALVAVALVRWDVRQWLLTVALALGALLAIVAVLQAFEALGGLLSNLFGSSGSSGGLGGGGGFGVGGSEGGSTVDVPPVALAAILGAAVVGAIVLSRLAGDDADADVERSPPAGPSIDPDEAVPSGTAFRERAAFHDRPADNEVYRAWLSLASAAGADPTRDSPGAVARQAAEAGVDRRAAREITALFEAVRYGEAEVTAELEERAKQAARQLGGVDR